MIRLQGGLELDEYWREVRKTGDERLQEFGLEDWVVTLRALTLPETGRAEAHEAEPAVTVSAVTKTLDIAVGKQPDLPPRFGTSNVHCSAALGALVEHLAFAFDILELVRLRKRILLLGDLRPIDGKAGVDLDVLGPLLR